jgi:uncharacterized membrane protein YfcA
MTRGAGRRASGPGAPWLSCRVTPVELAVLVVVGVTAGVVSTVVSLASIVSYPALLALGLPPVAANVTNTVSLVFTSLGAAAGSRPELVGQGRRVLRIGAVAATGGALGAALLLRTPATAFSAAVPVLIAVASAAILVQPRLTLRARTAGGAPSPWWVLVVVAAAVYVGYFGAAGGVLMLAALGGLLRDELVRLNALKNVVSGLANGVASIGFVLFGPVHWAVVVPLASGFLVGGSIGPRLARRLPTGSLRLLIAGAGLTVAAVLAVRTYG